MGHGEVVRLKTHIKILSVSHLPGLKGMISPDNIDLKIVPLARISAVAAIRKAISVFSITSYEK